MCRDSIGPGGIFRGLRTIPVILDIASEMEELCPNAILLNYVNPMAMACWALGEKRWIISASVTVSRQHLI